MEEKKIEDRQYTTKGIIINIEPDEFCIYDRKICKNNILGFFTDNVATCSALIISVNNDQIIFFCHFNEELIY